MPNEFQELKGRTEEMAPPSALTGLRPEQRPTTPTRDEQVSWGAGLVRSGLLPEITIACGSADTGRLTNKKEGQPAVDGYTLEQLHGISEKLNAVRGDISSAAKNSPAVASEKLRTLLGEVFSGKDKITIASQAESAEVTINLKDMDPKHSLVNYSEYDGVKVLVSLADGKQGYVPLNEIRIALRDGVKPHSTTRSCGFDQVS